MPRRIAVFRFRITLCSDWQIWYRFRRAVDCLVAAQPAGHTATDI